jgi:hypothetical protein
VLLIMLALTLGGCAAVPAQAPTAVVAAAVACVVTYRTATAAARLNEAHGRRNLGLGEALWAIGLGLIAGGACAIVAGVLWAGLLVQ